MAGAIISYGGYDNVQLVLPSETGRFQEPGGDFPSVSVYDSYPEHTANGISYKYVYKYYSTVEGHGTDATDRPYGINNVGRHITRRHTYRPVVLNKNIFEHNRALHWNNTHGDGPTSAQQQSNGDDEYVDEYYRYATDVVENLKWDGDKWVLPADFVLGEYFINRNGDIHKNTGDFGTNGYRTLTVSEDLIPGEDDTTELANGELTGGTVQTFTGTSSATNTLLTGDTGNVNGGYTGITDLIEEIKGAGTP